MVIASAISIILRQLEKYLLTKVNFQLGHNYSLILLIPAVSGYSEKYSWLISARELDNISQEKVILELFTTFKSILSFEEYSSIARINKINSNDPLVKNINFMFHTDEIVSISNFSIGNVNIDQGILVHSKILSKLKEGHAVTFVLNDGRRINAGIISIDNNYTIKHYTGAGLRELFPNENGKIKPQTINNTEGELIEKGYISFTNLDDIETIY